MIEEKIKKIKTKCTIEEVLDILGGKWAMSIIYVLADGKMRFKEIERTVPNINTRMLVKELKNMEANGILTRKVFATVPATVEYTLTKKGEKLLPIISDLLNWGHEYIN